MENGEVCSHSAGLLFMMGNTALLLDTRGAVDAGRRQEPPAVEDRGGRSHGESREQLTPGGGPRWEVT